MRSFRSIIKHLSQQQKHLIFRSLLGTIILLMPAIVIIWALTQCAQNNKNECSTRMKEKGFHGDSDFYGLGIRVGIYLQWFATIFANIMLPKQAIDIFGSYVVFSFALVIAVLLQTFQHDCTFTAEIVVTLYIYWGGLLGLTTTGLRWEVRDLNSVDVSYMVGQYIMFPFSVWFWLRLATVGEADFHPTPGGTSLFLLDRITSSHIKAVSGFMVFLCAYLYLAYLAGIIFQTWKIFTKSKSLKDSLDKKQTVGSMKGLLLPTLWRKNTRYMELFYFTYGFGIVIYSILAVELTLVWNSISDVYTVSSTGQAIPLILGIILLVNVLLKWWRVSSIKRALKKMLSRFNAEFGSDEESSGEGYNLNTSFQCGDGSWQPS